MSVPGTINKDRLVRNNFSPSIALSERDGSRDGSLDVIEFARIPNLGPIACLGRGLDGIEDIAQDGHHDQRSNCSGAYT